MVSLFFKSPTQGLALLQVSNARPFSPTTTSSPRTILDPLNYSPSPSLFYPSRPLVHHSPTSSPNTPSCLRRRLCTAFRLNLRLTLSPQSLVLDIHTNVHPLVYHSIHSTVFTSIGSRSTTKPRHQTTPLKLPPLSSFSRRCVPADKRTCPIS